MVLCKEEPHLSCNYSSEQLLEHSRCQMDIFECMNTKISNMLSTIQNRQLVPIIQDKCLSFLLMTKILFIFVSIFCMIPQFAPLLDLLSWYI